VIGGLITQYAGWRGVFAVNLAIGLVALAIALLVLPADTSRQSNAASISAVP
jgi:predicted MFS family arabinose efflux permease